MLFRCFGKLEGREMRFHCANGLVVQRILRTLKEALLQKCALLAAMLLHPQHKPGVVKLVQWKSHLQKTKNTSKLPKISLQCQYEYGKDWNFTLNDVGEGGKQ